MEEESRTFAELMVKLEPAVIRTESTPIVPIVPLFDTSTFDVVLIFVSGIITSPRVIVVLPKLKGP